MLTLRALSSRVVVVSRVAIMSVAPYSGEPGSGAGRGGGSGGSVRDAGGAFGKMEQAREEEYFRRLQKLQLKGLREQIDDEMEHHERQIKYHQDQIERNKKRNKELKQEEESLGK